MRRVFPVLLAFAVVLIAGCQSGEISGGERVVYVPRSSPTGLGAGDALGLSMQSRASRTAVASAPRTAPARVAAARPAPMPVVAAAPKAPAKPIAKAAQPSNVRMPLITFAPTDGPSAD